jgi:nucleoside-diphosphate-sugar epimerase
METGVEGEVFNVGSGSGTTVNQLLDLMQSVASCRLPVRHEAPDWTAGSQRVGDIGKIRRMLGWAPTVSLAEGLERTYHWMREQGSSPGA